MRWPLVPLLCATAMLGTTGCFRIGVTVGTEIPDEDVRRIVPGVTTKGEILDWFGAPAEATDGEIFTRLLDAGEIAAEDLVALPFADYLVYEITDGQGRAMVTLIFNWIRVDLKRDRLMVFFDEDDRVLYFGLTRQRSAPEDEGDDGGGGEVDARGPSIDDLLVDPEDPEDD